MASSTLASAKASPPAARARFRAGHRALGRFLGSRLAWVSGGLIVVLAAAAVLAPLLVTVDPLAISNDVLKRPGGAYLLGTDDLGRSVLAQMVYGIRASLTVGAAAAVAATLVGTVLGAIAGYVGGFLDGLIMRVSEMFQVMPTFVLAALIVALAGPGEFRIIMVIAVLAWPQTSRVVRAEVIRLKQLDFVAAARCLGITEARILAAEIVPNALPPVIALATLLVGQAILLEASLSFFGLGSPDVISWGRMLSSGQRFIFVAWWLSVFPGLAILVTVLAFNLVGDCISTALDPRAQED